MSPHIQIQPIWFQKIWLLRHYTIKYQYKIDNRERLTLLYATIDDNLMEDVDGGNIFGIGYSQGDFP